MSSPSQSTSAAPVSSPLWSRQRPGAQAYRFYTLDVFCDRPFGGNPLAVFPEATGLSGAQMQTLTRELNLSETVFVLPPETPQGTRRVRIFTPGQEIPFAGHPTVGTAFLLAALGQVPVQGAEGTIILEEGVGPVPVVIQAEADRPTASFLQVTQAPQQWPVDLSSADFGQILGLEPEAIGWVDNGVLWEPEALSCGLPFCFVPVKTRSALGRIQLQIDRWRALLAHRPYPHLYCFCPEPEHPAAQFRGRMFAPALGIPEDPATGSAVTAFAGYLCARSATTAVHTQTWGIEQGVEMGRPSFLSLGVDRVEVDPVKADLGVDRVEVTQKPATVPGIGKIQVGGRSILISEGLLYV